MREDIGETICISLASRCYEKLGRGTKLIPGPNMMITQRIWGWGWGCAIFLGGILLAAELHGDDAIPAGVYLPFWDHEVVWNRREGGSNSSLSRCAKEERRTGIRTCNLAAKRLGRMAVCGSMAGSS